MLLFFRKGYQPLRWPLQGKGDQEDNERDMQTKSSPSRCLLLWTLLVVLVISISMNFVAVYRQWPAPTKDDCKSDYAQLERVLPLPFVVEGRENTIPDEDWEYPIAGTGFVALTDDYVAEMHLTPAQRFPWDSSKGLYFLQGHHNLHCVKMVRKSILEYRNHSKQTEHHLHIDHCLTGLRENVLCEADDTPRHTGGHHKQPGSGQDQVRLCRDWAKLDQWADERSACFKEPEDWYDGKPESERYKFCPDGSEPWKMLETNSKTGA